LVEGENAAFVETACLGSEGDYGHLCPTRQPPSEVDDGRRLRHVETGTGIGPLDRNPRVGE
jgi:hypothetical protein